MLAGVITLYDASAYRDADSRIFPQAAAIVIIVTGLISLIMEFVHAPEEQGFGQGSWWRHLDMMQLPDDVKTSRQPSIIGGTAIIAGTAIGAGMFSLPVVSAGMGFFWAILCLVFTWFCMLHSALFILEINLNFEPGASFDTLVGQTLGPRWNLLNSLNFVFLLYILSYAFISGGGSSVSQTLHSGFDIELSPMISGLLFSALTALIVWIGTGMVSRITAIIIVGMVVSFALSIAQLSAGIKPVLFLDTHPNYLVYCFAALPIYLAAFGFHGNVPSLVKYYGKDPKRVGKCLIYG